MAIWHFKLDVLPVAAVKKTYGLIPVTIPEEAMEKIPWWEGIPFRGIRERLPEVLPEGKSWSESALIWGDEEFNSILIYLNEEWEGIDMFIVKIDARTVDTAFIVRMVEFAKSLELLFVTRSNQVIQPEYGGVLEALSRSGARSFVNDPSTYLKSLPKRSIYLDGNDPEERQDWAVVGGGECYDGGRKNGVKCRRLIRGRREKYRNEGLTRSRKIA